MVAGCPTMISPIIITSGFGRISVIRLILFAFHFLVSFVTLVFPVMVICEDSIILNPPVSDENGKLAYIGLPPQFLMAIFANCCFIMFAIRDAHSFTASRSYPQYRIPERLSVPRSSQPPLNNDQIVYLSVVLAFQMGVVKMREVISGPGRSVCFVGVPVPGILYVPARKRQ